jgi:AP-3 complex subunit beta
MSSIRVLDIVQVIVLAIEKSVKDSSPYVRKAAAHAIPKVYRLDPDKKEHLTEIITTLLNDQSTMVLGSAVAAFLEVCPDELDLIHKHYRKLCKLVADIDEWGQIFILTLLTRYARTQFLCPDPSLLESTKKSEPKKSKSFYGDEEGEDEEAKDDDVIPDMDPDHRLLLKATTPLLQSRNNGVVMAVAALHFYLAPSAEAQKVGKPLARILRSNREAQYVVLANIATMACTRPSMFEPQLSEFFVSAGDAEFTRTLKLEILTQIATENNIQRILREFKEYVRSEDKKFVTATIQAIGRCAANIPEVTETCMHGLMALMNNPSEAVVAEAVIEIKKLLQLGANDTAHERRHRNIIRHLAKLLDTITAPMARASIVWVVGEYCEKVPLIAPDVLRKLAKSFADEHDIVKLQVLNLGAKLYLTNQEQTGQIYQYVLTLAKYDSNYDVRDRGRMMRVMLLNKEGVANTLSGAAKTLFINQKPAPTATSISKDRQRFMLGSLSHVVNHSAMGYQQLPDFPEEAPDPSVRNPPEVEQRGWAESPSVSSPRNNGKSINWDEDDFYGEGERADAEGDYEQQGSVGSYEKERDFYSDEEYSDDYYSDEYYSDEYDDGEELPPPKAKPAAAKVAPATSNGKPAAAPKQAAAPAKPAATQAKKAPAKATSSSAAPDLDDLFGFVPSSPPKTNKLSASSNSLVDDLAGLSISSTPASPSLSHKSIFSQSFVAPTQATPRKVLLKGVLGGGLEIEYSFARRPSVYGPRYNSVQLYFRNTSENVLSNIKIGKTNLAAGMEIKPFSEIKELQPGASADQLLSVMFNNISQAVKFEITHDRGTYNVTLAPQIGELVKPANLSMEEYADKQRKLGGMNEATESITIAEGNLNNVGQLILDTADLAVTLSDRENGKYKFAGETLMSDEELVLVNVDVKPASGIGRVYVNCENGIFASVLLKKIVEVLVKE